MKGRSVGGGVRIHGGGVGFFLAELGELSWVSKEREKRGSSGGSLFLLCTTYLLTSVYPNYSAPMK